MNMGINRGIIAVLAGLVWATGATAVENADSLQDAIKDGTGSGSLRLAGEYVNKADTTAPGHGLGVQLRLNYETASYRDTTGFIQLQAVVNGIEQHSHADGGDVTRDLIQDPDGERVHQAYLDNHKWENTLIRFGRQEVILDNARLVGNIGWRQQAQSFDGLLIKNTSLEDITLVGAYLNAVNTIVNTQLDLDHLILLHADYAGIEDHTVSVYSYLNEYEGSSVKDSATYGARFTGTCGEDQFVNYAIDYSVQNDYADGKDHGGDMLNLFVNFKLESVSIGGGYSRISGMDGSDKAFDTLVSTAHAFNGWADQFLATNGGGLANGLEDLYFQVGTTVNGTKLLARYHFFDTTESNAGGYDKEYGTELDLLATRKLNDDLSMQVKLALFDGVNSDEAGAKGDKDVLWVRLLYSF